MKILVIGSGAREHALAWKLSREPDVGGVIFAPGNPGIASVARCLPADVSVPAELLAIAELMLHDMNYKFSPDARDAFIRYIAARKTQPLFSNARSIRNALDRIRLRQANRLVADLDRVMTADDIMSLEASDVLASRVFSKDKC